MRFWQTYLSTLEMMNNFDPFLRCYITFLVNTVLYRHLISWYQPPCKVEMNTTTSFSSNTVSSWPLSSQSQSFTRTRTPGLLRKNYTNISIVTYSHGNLLVCAQTNRDIVIILTISSSLIIAVGLKLDLV